MTLGTEGSAAERYRLVAGDTIELMYSGLGEPAELTIDIDGQVRVINVGGVAIADLTMDEAEEKLEADIIASGMFIEPNVSVQLMEYAPIVVAGDVANPGRFDFTAGMTVSSALALSGGSELAGISRYELQTTKSVLDSKLRALNLEIASKVADIARYQAILDEADTVALTDEWKETVPAPNAVNLQALFTKSDDIYQSENALQAELMTVWDEEIAAVEEQLVLFADRIAVQQEIVASAAVDLENARDLQERGLQTSMRLSDAQQRDADARANMIELESARILANQTVADAKAEKSQYLTTRKTEALRIMKDEQTTADTMRVEYASVLEQLALLTSGSISALLNSDAVHLNYVLQGPRADRVPASELDESTTLLPGDTVIVYLKSAELTSQEAPVVAGQ